MHFALFFSSASDGEIFASISQCQSAVHEKGHANAVVFESSKESKHILSRSRPVGTNFKILGVSFDCKLIMLDAVQECVHECGWRLLSLVRTCRFHTDRELVLLYKAHILLFIEYRTCAFSHASNSVLAPLDKIQHDFLRSLGIADLDALHHFNLAPLSTRRDIANLGLIHRTVLGIGPPCFGQFFSVDSSPPPFRAPRRHFRHLCDPCSLRAPDYLVRSALGGTRIYNLLPDSIVEASQVKLFQRNLSELLREASSHTPRWQAAIILACAARFPQSPSVQ